MSEIDDRWRRFKADVVGINGFGGGPPFAAVYIDKNNHPVWGGSFHGTQKQRRALLHILGTLSRDLRKIIKREEST